MPVGPGNPIVITGFRFLPFLYDRMVCPLFKLAALTRTEELPNDGNVSKPNGADERRVGRWPDRAPT